LSSIILSEERDESMLKAVAHVCRKQGTYKLACKMFTQAGDRINAIKSLLSTGDVQNIITYANASRSKDVYILTANHLQKLQTE
jgi:intraflagellar transport protein 140